jgi:AraC family transcriptional regulator, transcriptional activator of pobA
MKNTKQIIPTYQLTPSHQERHRDTTIITSFGYHSLPYHLHIPGFEIYSTDGLKDSYGPAKSNFYRIGILLSGSLDMQIGLEQFHAIPGSINFSIPGQVHSKWNISEDLFGYYILLEASFLETLLSPAQLRQDFPFYNHAGMQYFTSTPAELEDLTSLFLKINQEVQEQKSGRETAIRMYLYLLLLAANRCYEKHVPNQPIENVPGSQLLTSYYKLIGEHFLEKRQVSEYAKLLNITPNHLNRVVKNITGKTASDAIDEMLVQEAKVLLRNTDLSAAEIAYQLDFSEPSAFNHFFKNLTTQTPLDYRKQIVNA